MEIPGPQYNHLARYAIAMGLDVDTFNVFLNVNY